jgi:porphobilinogen synthase
MVSETSLAATDFIYPLFLVHGEGVRKPISSMPGICQLSVDEAVLEAHKASSAGVPALLLFGIPAEKDPVGIENYAPDGIVQQAIRAIKAELPNLLIVTDVCLCEYTDHGHCGILNHENPHLPAGYVLNDATLEVLQKASVSHAQAGADIVAPSGMIDGMVAAMRTGLDAAGFEHIPIMSYAVKYASGYYGPFREAAEGTPKSGDRRTHQMDPANVREALREAAIDVCEGADFLMVKPALAYLDVIQRRVQR